MLKIEEIQEIIKLIDQSSINEFTYESNGTSVILKKSPEQPVIAQTAHVPAPPAIEYVPRVEDKPLEQAAAQSEPAAETASASKVDYDYEIVSPMVGTLYRSPSPDSDSFVNIGSKVTASTTVCIVEAMKLFNEIEAEVDGEIVEILAEDGELIEFGQPLFRVKKN